MINASKHIVEKLNLEFNTLSEDHGKQLERQSTELFQQKLLPEMEKLFDKYGDHQHIRLENLSLEIDVKEPVQFEEQFIRQFLGQLAQKLETASKNQPESKDNTEDLLSYFLENGYFPWWAKEHSVDDLEKQLLQRKKVAFSITEVLENNPERLKRLVFQFSDQLLQTVISDQNLDDFILKLQQVLAKHFTTAEVRNQLWQFVFEAVCFRKLNNEQAKIYIFKNSIAYFSAFQKSPPIQFDSAKEVAATILKDLKPFDEDLFLKLQAAVQSINFKEENAVLKTKSKQVTDQKEWYIQNAGLVLLHPFLVMLFESLGFTEKNDFKNKYSQNQAALLLQYLVTGNTQHAENELVFNKILCEIPLSMPIEKEIILNDKIIAESEQLLNAVIKHWSALKNTSPDGLRNTFLQREGKLTKNNDGSWKLFVQQNTVDILISKLPWSVSIIKLPWMKNMLQVEWA